VLFARRAERFASLAAGSSMADFLSFMAEIARAQSAALETLLAGTAPGRRSWLGIAPFDRNRWRPDTSWQRALTVILDRLGRTALTAETRSAIDRLAKQDAHALDTLATQAACFETGEAEPAAACLVFAALQVYWSGMAGALAQPDPSGIGEQTDACPICSSPPVASVVHSAGSLAGSRFLLCPLCATEWHMVRIKCANCGSTKGIAYLEIDGAGGIVKAETCDECRTYTKIIYTEKAPSADAFADDLASVALDVMVGEAGWVRATPNPFLIPGAG